MILENLTGSMIRMNEYFIEGMRRKPGIKPLLYYMNNGKQVSENFSTVI